MRFKQVAGANGTGDHILVSGKNSDTVTIPKGAPCILTLNGTDDGFAVVLPSTAGAAKSNAFLWGVAVQPITVGNRDDLYATGYCPYVILRYATRAATTDSWTSSASIASGFWLGIDTLNNAFVTLSASVGTGNNPFAVLLDSVASFAASASATSDTRTALTVGVRAFLRII